MNKININFFCYEDKIIYPDYLSDQCFDDVLDLLLVNNHYVLIKDFNRLMFSKTKNKNKKWFCKSCLCFFSSEKVLTEHGRDCLLINGGQNVNMVNMVKINMVIINMMINMVKMLCCTEERMLFLNLFRVFLMSILIVDL